MTKPEYEIEEAAGGYVRNGDVLEWRWKGQEETPAAEEEKRPAKKPRGRPKKAEAKK